MCTAHLPTVRASAASCQYWWGGGPQVNKFEQVSSDCHQMPPAGAGAWGTRAGAGMGVPCLTSKGVAGDLYSEVQCTMSNGYMGTPSPWADRQDKRENISFPQLCWQAVTNVYNGRIFQTRPGSTNPLFWNENLLFSKIFAANCMQVKEIGMRGGRVPPSTPPPLIRQWPFYHFGFWTQTINVINTQVTGLKESLVLIFYLNIVQSIWHQGIFFLAAGN